MKHVFTFLFLLLTAFIGVSNAAVRYVKPTAAGNGSGSNWNNASADLQAMINASSAGDEVWVAAGTYIPTTLTGGMATSTGSLEARDVSFVLKSGVKVYGGFLGNESSISQRTAGNVTILSGDLGTTNDATDNAYHVVISVNNNANTLLDGVSIIGGYAYGSGNIFVDGQTIPRTAGGGMYFRGSALVLNNVKIYNNESSLSAGGIYVRTSQPTFNNSEISNNKSATGAGIFSFGTVDSVVTLTIQQNSVLSNNTSTTGTGGAINLSSYSTASFTDVTFSGNTGTHGGALYSIGTATKRNELNLLRVNFSENIANATGAGAGAIYIHNRNNAVLNFVTFNNNQAISGGAIFVQGVTTDLTTELQLSNSSFTGNTARDGGGLFINSNVNATVENNSFKSNLANATSTGSGGGAYIAGATVTLKGNSFSENASNGSGGGAYILGANITIQDSFFSKNRTNSGSGAGMYIGAVSVSSKVQNCRFYENTATAVGGGIFLINGTTTNIIDHCLFYANTASLTTLGGGGIFVSNGAKPTVTNSTFYANSSVFGGGGISLNNNNTVDATVANCIFYGNVSNDAVAPDIYKGANAVLTLTSSLTQLYSTGTGLLIGANPLFASTDPAKGNFLMLNLGSPAIDAGNDGYIAAGVTLDLAGKIRKYNGTTVDMGAFENQGINPLPVVLSYFTAKAGVNRVELKWQTLSEQNNDYFLIERSTDSKSFTTITKIAGQGTASNITNYTAVDYSPLAGTNYYRLKQVDKDGKVTDYDIKAVEFKLSDNLVKIYPNPVVSGTATLQLGSGNYNLAEVINTYGRVVKTIAIQPGATSQSISLNELPQAVYQIRFTGFNVRPKVQRVIKL